MRRIIILVLSKSLLLAGCAADPLSPAVSPNRPTSPAPMQPAAGSTWELVLEKQIDHSMRVTAFLDAQFAVTGGPSDSGKAFYSVDGGQSWTQADSSAECLFGLDIVNTRVVWQCSSGPVRVSTDGAHTWQPVSDYGSFCRQLSFLNADTGWIAGIDQLAVTQDGGVTWTPVNLPETSRAIAAIALRTPTDGYLLDITGTLYITSDGGVTWSSHVLPLHLGENQLPDHDTASSAVRFVDAEHGLVIVHDVDNQHSQIVALSTSDTGQTWHQEVIIEEAPIMVSVYLSHDASTLTVADKFTSQIVVLHHSGGNQ